MTIGNTNNVSIVKFNGYAQQLNIPSTVDYNGTTYIVTIIEDFAFKANGIQELTIPDSVTDIGVNAFVGNRITSLTLGEGIINIGDGAFLDARITSLTIPNSVVKIGKAAFASNDLLTSVTLGSNLAILDRYAFAYSSTLSMLTSLNPTPPTIDQYVFSNTRLITLTIPDGTKSDYINAGWTPPTFEYPYEVGQLIVGGIGINTEDPRAAFHVHSNATETYHQLLKLTNNSGLDLLTVYDDSSISGIVADNAWAKEIPEGGTNEDILSTDGTSHIWIDNGYTNALNCTQDIAGKIRYSAVNYAFIFVACIEDSNDQYNWAPLHN